MGTFLFFLFSFLSARKKHKNANKRTSDFFLLRCFLSAFLFLFACSVLYFCLVASLCFWCFWCFWCVRNLFVKKNKAFKTALITSFTLLLSSFSGQFSEWSNNQMSLIQGVLESFLAPCQPSMSNIEISTKKTVVMWIAEFIQSVCLANQRQVFYDAIKTRTQF